MPKLSEMPTRAKKMPIYTKLVLYVFGLAFALIIAGGLLFAWNNRPPQAYYLIAEIEPGTSKSDIYEILGPPQDESTANTVYYYRPFSIYTLYVCFDDDDRYTDSYLDD